MGLKSIYREPGIKAVGTRPYPCCHLERALRREIQPDCLCRYGRACTFYGLGKIYASTIKDASETHMNPEDRSDVVKTRVTAAFPTAAESLVNTCVESACVIQIAKQIVLRLNRRSAKGS